MVYFRCRKIFWAWKDSESTDGDKDDGNEIHSSLDQQSSEHLNYAFEIPKNLVGLLMGKQGKNINFLKEKTHADILVQPHPTCTRSEICLISGTEKQIKTALRKIRAKFPPERHPSLTLNQLCFLSLMQCPDNLMLSLPEGSAFDAILSATVTAGHFFLQQPTHPTFHSLDDLTTHMSEMYNKHLVAPYLPHMEKGFVCVAYLYNCWYRAEIVEVYYESDSCKVKFLDYGGYCVFPRSALRQINCQFMNVPFQATECYLGLVAPVGGTKWSPQATACFEELAVGQVLQGFIIAYAPNGVPVVQLYRTTDHTDINMALLSSGHAVYSPICPQ